MSTRRSVSSLLIGLLFLLVGVAAPAAASGEIADIDAYMLFNPVEVQILSIGIGASNFTDPSRDYLAEYRAGIYSYFHDSPGLGMTVGIENFPLESFHRTSTSTETYWQFRIVYNGTTQPNFHPYDAYSTFALYCQRQSDTGRCRQIEGGILRYYLGEEDSDMWKKRQWLLYFDAINLQCCDGRWEATRQDCPDCKAKNYLPLILGCVFGFIGLVGLIVSIALACQHRKRKKQQRGIADAGHRPPPKNIGPAFEVHKATPNHHHHHHPHPHHPIAMRPDNMQSAPPPPVVVTVHNAGKQKHPSHPKKDEPDYASESIAKSSKPTSKGSHMHHKAKG